MAEAIALGASIYAFFQIAGAATKLSRSLYRTARTAGSARNEIQEFAMDIGAFAAALGYAHHILEGHCQRALTPLALRYVRDQEILKKLVEQAERIKEHMEGLRPQIRDLRGRLPWISVLIWHLSKRAEVKALHPGMESVKSNLTLVITTISLEIALQKPESPEKREKIKHLKRVINVQLETISILQNQIRLSSSRNQPSPTSHMAVEQHSLIELARSMVETGAVPETDPDPPSSASDTSSAVSSWTTSPESPPPSHHTRSPLDVHISRNNSRNLASRSSGQSTNALNVMVDVRSLHSQPTAPDPSVHVSEPGLRPIEDEERTSYLAIHSTDPILKFYNFHASHAERAHIINKDGHSVPVLAMIHPSLPANIVSERFAIAHSLDFHETEHNVVLELHPGVRRQSIGEVIMRWDGPLAHQRRPLRFRCWVVPYNEHEGYPLILGEPFVDGQEHYWGRGRPGGS